MRHRRTRASRRQSRCIRALVLTTAAVAAGVGVPPAAEAATLREQLQHAYTEFRSGLRHEDGGLTCGRMTLGYRRQELAAVAEEGIAGLGCVTVFDLVGRDVYNELDPRNARLGRVTRASATRARALQRAGGSICFARVDGRWRLARADNWRVLDCRS